MRIVNIIDHLAWIIILLIKIIPMKGLLILLLPFVLGSCAIGIIYEVEFPPKIKESLTPEEETEKGE